jgi:hypothetical protein
MNKIDEIFKKERGAFDDREPSEGHFERFSYKLATRLHAGGTKRSIVPYLLKAAVVTLLVTLSSLWTYDHFIRPDLKKTMTLSEVSPEYKEVENYYVQQVSFMEGEFTNLDFKNNPEQKEIMLSELQSMDSVYVDLQKELRANPNDQRIVNAMIKHYQTKIEVMSYILEQLKQINTETENTGSHEKVTI